MGQEGMHYALYSMSKMAFINNCLTATTALRSDSGFAGNWQSGKSLTECNLHMLTSEDSCDVTFLVGKDEKAVRAHRYVLISRSSVFHTMLCGPLAEKDDIKIPDVEADIFYELLMHLYTEVGTPSNDNVMSLLYLSKKYAIGSLEKLCVEYLVESLAPENACIIMEHAHFFDEQQLFNKALKCVQDNWKLCQDTNVFLVMCHLCFHRVISSLDLTTNPELILRGALSWAEEDCKRQGREMTRENIRLSLGKTLYHLPFIEADLSTHGQCIILEQFLIKEEIEMIILFQKSPEKTQDPFQRPRCLDYVDSCNIEKPLGTTDILFYDQHQKVTSFDNEIGGGMDFTSNMDVLLHGMHLYTPEASIEPKYHVSIQKFLSPVIFEDREYTVTKAKGQPVTEVYLKQPLPIMKHVRYCMYVKLTVEDCPWYVGDGERREVSVGECTFTKESQEYVNNYNLIYGFIIGH